MTDWIDMMKYVAIIESELPDILKSVSKKIVATPELHEFVGEVEIENFITEQEKLLYKFFIEYESDFDTEFINDFYARTNIPFLIIYKSLKTLKSTLMQKLLDKLDDVSEIFVIEEFVNELLNRVSKIYIQKEIASLSGLINKQFNKYLLYSLHSQWLIKIVDAVEQDALEKFPLSSSKSCAFSKGLEYPESMMVCIDENLCLYLDDLHTLVHKSANTFYLYYKKEDFYQAYLIYKELLEQVMKFKKSIVELYFLSYSNLEENFFKLISSMLYNKSDITLTLINIKKLKVLNTNYGEVDVNKLLKEVDSALQKVVHKNEQSSLLIHGVTADYYMLNIGNSVEQTQALNNYLYEILNKTYQIDSKKIPLRATIVTLNLDKFYEKNRDELTRLMLHLKAKAEHANESCFIYSEDDKKELMQWLDARYQNIDFVNNKLNEEDVEVVFQPIFAMENNKVAIAEALVRFKEKDKLIPAGAFIDTVYEMDKIALLDMLVLKNLMKQKSGIFDIVDTLFINVSYKSFLDVEYMKVFEEFMELFHDKSMVFELTEQNIVENMEDIIEIHNKYGVQFAVDDFGSGYSSLKTVADLARNGVLKVLKMDGELIEKVNSDAYIKKIIKVISKLSTTLELVSVAEYIEDAASLQTLKELDVTYAQGFYLSKPLRIEELLIAKLNGNLEFI